MIENDTDRQTNREPTTTNDDAEDRDRDRRMEEARQTVYTCRKAKTDRQLGRQTFR